MMKRMHNTTHYLLTVLTFLFLSILPACATCLRATHRQTADRPVCNKQEPASLPTALLKPDSPLYLVTRVIDGDTIVLENGTHIRYIGINTPETKDPRKPVEYFGKEASAENTKLVLNKKVRLEYDVQKIDKYGRTLAYVYLPIRDAQGKEDEIFVNAWLVENGFARVSTYPPDVKYQDKFRELERKAREGKKGLWAPDVEQKKDTTIPPAQTPAVKEEPKSTDENTEEVTGYITKTGKKYHRGDCQWLYASRIPVTLKEAKKRGYEPCKVCKPPE
jgi:micrococcal nuclease